MRSMILVAGLSLLAMATEAQSNGRVRSGTPLRWTMKNGSQEIMEGDLVRNYGTTDTVNRQNVLATTGAENPHITRIASVEARCDNNSIVFNWVALQQPGTDRYELEQTTDGGMNWTPVGTVPANRIQTGEASYTFRYNRNLEKLIFRVSAVNNTGERVSSSRLESPCQPNSYRAISPNPVYSTANLQLGTPNADRVRLLLVNNAGVIVQNREAGLLPGTNQVPVDMSSLPQGYYTLFIQWKTGRQEVFKLLKR